MDSEDRKPLLPSSQLCSLRQAVFGISIFFLGLFVGLGSHLFVPRGNTPLYDAYHKLFLEARYVDLTHSFSPSSPLWFGFNSPLFNSSVSSSTFDGFIQQGEAWSYANQGFVASSYLLTTDQMGTQLDPPAHFNEYGATISDIPPTVALRPLVVIDIHQKVKADPWYSATVHDVLAWESKHQTRVPEGSVVMFRSDWGKTWDTMHYNASAPFPGVSLATIKFLHLNRSILFHGHEPLDTDSTPNLESEAWLLRHNYMQAEGVANLDKVPEIGALITIGFAKPLGGTGGFARFVAVCPKSWKYGKRIEKHPGAPLPTQSAPLRRGADGVMRPEPGAEPVSYCASGTALGCPME